MNFTRPLADRFTSSPLSLLVYRLVNKWVVLPLGLVFVCLYIGVRMADLFSVCLFVYRYVSLNGLRLHMIDDRTLPVLAPKQLTADQAPTLPPRTFGFFVIPNAKASACL